VPVYSARVRRTGVTGRAEARRRGLVAAMKTEIKIDIQAQPDDETCGPTCLHALYRYYGRDDITLRNVVDGVHRLATGGTLLEILACHALRAGFDATIYTYHIQVFDPTWFADDGEVHDPTDVTERLRRQLKLKPEQKRLKIATRAAAEFLSLGGRLKMEDLTPALIKRYLALRIPIITGLSSTFLYRESREISPNNVEDDVRGDPQGHFVMLLGYDGRKREVLVADPLDDNPPFHTSKYRLSMDRLVNAMLLGILTHDANLLIIRPKPGQERPLSRRRKTPVKRPARATRPASAGPGEGP